MKKIFYFLMIFGAIAFNFNAKAQLTNPGFETGDLSGWTVNGYGYASTGETYNAWVIIPANSYMGFIQPSGAFYQSDAETALGLSSGSLIAYNPGLFGNTTNFSALTQDVALNAGQSITMYWNFVSTDYAPYNDGCIGTFTGPSYQEIHILSVTSNAYGDLEAVVVGDYGSSGWYGITFTAPTAGVYRVGFANFNIADEILNPWNFSDNAPGGTSAPGDPIVTTDPVTNIAPPTATSGGSVADNGGTPSPSVRGVCWNTTGSPTLADDFTTDGSGFGSFTSTLSGLINGQTYYVRAYATNTNGTFYGPQVEFGGGGLPETPVSNWALILGGIAIALFTVYRVRKIM